MAKYFFVCFYVFCFYLTATPYEDFLNQKEPSCFIDGKVNVITGNLYQFDPKISVSGFAPINLNLTYVSLSLDENMVHGMRGIDEYLSGGWNLIKHIKAFASEKVVRVIEPDGMILEYEMPKIEQKSKGFWESKKDKKKREEFNKNEREKTRILPLIENFYHAALLSNFSTVQENYKNHRVQLEAMHRLHIYSQGKERYYQKDGKQDNIFVLYWEKLADGNKILYSYDKFKNLTEIKSVNGAGNKIYAWVKFHYLHPELSYDLKKEDKKDFDIETSDGFKFEIRHKRYCKIMSTKERGAYPFFLLEKINSPLFSREFSYKLDLPKLDPLLEQFTTMDGKIFFVDYYISNGNVDPSDKSLQKVKTLRVQSDGQKKLLYSFEYDFKNGKTKVYDALNNLTIYSINNFKIGKIERFENLNGSQKLKCEEIYSWQNNFLMEKSFLDEDGKVISHIKYYYDQNANLAEEKFYGNISGKSINEAISNESFSKRYTYHPGTNYLTSIGDDSDLKTSYTYLFESNLLSSKIISHKNQIKKRFFYEYNQDQILVKEISDDGSSENKNDLSNVSFRHIKNFTIKQDSPSMGLPIEIEEAYLDVSSNKTKLLKKEVIRYNAQGEIIQKDIFDENNNFCYSLFFKYDLKNNLIYETDPVGRKVTFKFDDNNKKIQENYLDKKIEINFTYDSLKRLVKKQIVRGDKFYLYEYKYDDLNNISSNEEGVLIFYKHDLFNNLIEKIYPQILDENQNLTDLKEASIYDGASREILKLDGLKNQTQIFYNIFNRPILISYPDKSEEIYIYNLDNTLKDFINKEGTITHFEYDCFKRVILKQIFGKNNELLQEEKSEYKDSIIAYIDPMKNKRSYFYDLCNRLIKEEFHSKDGKLLEKKEYFYDSLGRLRKTIIGDTLVCIEEKDFLNRTTEERKEDLSGAVLFKQRYEYEPQDNYSQISYINNNETKKYFAFDAIGRIILQRDPLGFETHFVYEQEISPLGQKLFKKTIIDPLMKKKEIFTDSLNREVAIEKKGASGRLWERSNTYDLASNLIYQEESSFLQEGIKKLKTSYSYDSLHRVISKTEGVVNLRTTLYEYTPMGLLKKKIKPDNEVIQYEYDDLQNKIRAFSSDSSLDYSYEYDQLCHLIQVQDNNNQSIVKRDVDALGNVLYEKLGNFVEINRSFDLLNRIENFELFDLSSISYVYDPFHLKEVIRTSLSKDQYYHRYVDYDLDGNLQSEKLIGDLGYDFFKIDPLKRVVFLETPSGAQKVKDSNFNSKKITWQIFWGKDESSYEFDDFYNPKSEEGLFFNQYTYDSYGKVLRKNEQLFEYDELNQLISTDDIEYTYNINGKVITKKSKDEEVQYDYDPFDRLVQINKKDQKIIFSYDGLDRLISQTTISNKNETELSQTSYFLYDGDLKIGEVDQDKNITKLKVLGKDHRPIAFELNKKVFAPLYDIFGNLSSIISVTSGLVVEAYRYSLDGEKLIFNAAGKSQKASSYFDDWFFLKLSQKNDAVEK
ncbi:MAG: hypothetical protein HZB76_01365 [Chlamydiae bacterium]|nr:hypothetical protein [Chlamydiota bacterium]